MVHTYFAPSSHKFVIYQLLVRLFGNNNLNNKPYGTIKENGIGKFNDISDTALLALKETGITHIWFTGILEHSTLTGFAKNKIPADDPHIVKGRAGSPYAIRDYYDVSADLAENVELRLEEFDAMIDRTYKHGLKAIIDFVPNHVARSYHSDKKPNGINDFGDADDKTKLFLAKNNFLYLPGKAFCPPSDYIPLGGGKLLKNYKKYKENPARVTGNDVYSATPGMDDWFETVKLNFGVDPNTPQKCYFDPIPLTWIMLLDVLLYWCRKGIDGFRCDMAEMVPAEFWEWVIPCVKTQFPDVIFIGEIYKPDQYEYYLDKGSFDYLYDKVCLYDTLAALLRGNGNADGLTSCARSIERYPDRMLSFLENHDEERIAWKGFTNDAFSAIPAMVVCATISKGPVMIYFGQEVGETAEGNMGFAGERGRTSIFDYCGLTELQKWVNKGKFDGKGLNEKQIELRLFYKKILNLCRSEIAFAEGEFYDLQYINRFNQSEGYDERFIYSFIRYSENQRILVITNFNRRQEYDLSVKIPAGAWKAMGLDMTKKYSFYDLLNNRYKKSFNAKDIAIEKDRMAGLIIKMPVSSAFLLQIEEID